MDPNREQITDLGEISFDKLFEAVLSCPVLPPNSLRLAAVDQITAEELRGLLGHFLVKAARKILSKELYLLTSEELDQIRPYLWSIGFEVEASLVPLERHVTDHHPDGTPFIRTVRVNKWNYEFSTYTAPPLKQV